MPDIQPEIPLLHAGAIEALYDQTFGPGHFAKTAERLRENSQSVYALNRIALIDEKIVAVVRVWPIAIERGGRALFVGPVAVDPRFRGDRLGLKVTDAALCAAEQAGWPGAILIGHPAYFSEIGFLPVPAGQLRFPGPQDTTRVLYRNLASDCADYSGKIRTLGHSGAVDNAERHSLGLGAG